MLRARGHEVAEAADRATALARWQAGGIVAIVTDLELGIDDADGGAALIAAVRAAEASPARAAPPARTRIVVCSGSLVPEERARLDHDAYLAKPVGPQTLIEALARLGVAAPATAGSR
jgi:CheY-like chemotaxis protein